MTKYTDEQINEAIMLANQTSKVYAWETEMYRNVIEHLPEPATDDWQQCAWDDILHTDERVKAEYISGTIIEGVPDGINDDAVFLVDSHVIRYRTDAKWYRIPAPVVAPDPDSNPVILIREVQGKTYDPPVVAIIRESATQNHPVYVYGDHGSAFPDYITDWSPAKAVVDNG